MKLLIQRTVDWKYYKNACNECVIVVYNVNASLYANYGYLNSHQI